MSDSDKSADKAERKRRVLTGSLTPQHTSSSASQPKPAEKPVILVIEDNKDVQIILTAQLDYYGFKVVCKSDGPSGLEWLEKNKADLVILDLMLPGMSGFVIAERIRERFSPSQLPILMLSALGVEADDRVRGLEAGANDIMAKPYKAEELVARIRILLKVTHTTQEAESITSTLSRYMSSVLRAQAKIDPNMLMRRQYRHAVVMFADLRGFTRMASHSSPEKMLSVLDEFFDAMMRVVDEYGGIVFDLIGDEFLAAFNVPYDVPVPSYLAVQAAVQMQRLFDKLRVAWLQEGVKVGLGIGIHQGEVVLGHVGSEELMRYTVMGNVVNIAHRLVDLASDGEIIVSKDLYDALHVSSEQLPFVPMPEVRIKGLSEPMQLYKLVTNTAHSTGTLGEE